jgi:hypothetical protein
MTEQDLKDLKFKKDFTDDTYYYVLDVGTFCLITKQCADEIKRKNDWTVHIFDNSDIAFKKREPLEELIAIIKAHKTKKG